MKNAKFIVFFNFLWMLIPAISILIPYFMSLGLSMKDFFWLQSFFGLVVVLMEVPSGYLADLFGRKKLISFGAFLSGLGFTVLYFSKNLLHLYIHELLIGLSLSLMSGADYALMFDSIKNEIKTPTRKLQAKWTSYFMMGSFLGEALAGVVSSLLSLMSLSHVLLATAFLGWCPFALSLFLKEVKIKKMDEKRHKENFSLVIGHMFRDSLYLRALIVNFVIWSLSTMCVVWLIQKYWEHHNLPIYFFGILWALFSVIGALANNYSHDLEVKLGFKKLVLICAGCVVISYVFLSFLPFSYSFIFFPLFYVARGVFQPVFKEGFNHRIQEEFRATANSIYSLIFRLSFMVVGPLLGTCVDEVGIHYLFLILGFVFSILAVLFLIPFLNQESSVTSQI